jgi:hypothetical protein
MPADLSVRSVFSLACFVQDMPTKNADRSKAMPSERALCCVPLASVMIETTSASLCRRMRSANTDFFSETLHDLGLASIREQMYCPVV